MAGKQMTSDLEIRRPRRTIMRRVPRNRRRIFPHRRNVDGTIDSICGECFSTVASAGAEVDLQVAENAHICKGLKFSKVLRPLDRN